MRRCQLETPQDGIVDYEPGDVHKSTEKYHIELGTSISVCQVTVVNIDAKDEGVWTMAFTDKQGVSESQVHNVTVNFAGKSVKVFYTHDNMCHDSIIVKHSEAK